MSSWQCVHAAMEVFYADVRYDVLDRIRGILLDYITCLPKVQLCAMQTLIGPVSCTYHVHPENKMRIYVLGDIHTVRFRGAYDPLAALFIEEWLVQLRACHDFHLFLEITPLEITPHSNQTENWRSFASYLNVIDDIFKTSLTDSNIHRIDIRIMEEGLLLGDLHQLFFCNAWLLWAIIRSDYKLALPPIVLMQKLVTRYGSCSLVEDLGKAKSILDLPIFKKLVNNIADHPRLQQIIVDTFTNNVTDKHPLAIESIISAKSVECIQNNQFPKEWVISVENMGFHSAHVMDLFAMLSLFSISPNKSIIFVGEAHAQHCRLFLSRLGFLTKQSAVPNKWQSTNDTIQGSCCVTGVDDENSTLPFQMLNIKHLLPWFNQTK